MQRGDAYDDHTADEEARQEPKLRRAPHDDETKEDEEEQKLSVGEETRAAEQSGEEHAVRSKRCESREACGAHGSERGRIQYRR